MPRSVFPEDAPKPIGPYTPGVIAAGEMILTSGQVGFDPATQKLVDGGVSAQTQQALTNVQRILDAAGASLTDVVRCTVYLTDMAHFAEMNAVYATFFPENPPTRSTVAVAALPANALVEIDAIAVRDRVGGDGSGPHWVGRYK
jgi:2-iminobutanoate/2-iminopropanoate deaminase